MMPPPPNIASDQGSAPTIDPTEAPKPQTRASDLDASDAGVQTTAVSPDRAAASGRYVLTAFHARGGMGEVWRCQDATIGREVALKRLVSERAAARERFLCEAQVTGQLQHPGIVPVHDLGFDDAGRPYYVMSFVQGRTLKSAIETFHSAIDATAEKRQIERTRLLKIFLDVCHAVAYAHSRGIIHRDLKPDNIMLGPFGETVLLDWGLAKLKDRSEIPGPLPASAPAAMSGSTVHTEDGSIMGSPLYMPPEMASGHIADADARTDVYLLGSTLYEILTGRPPRQGANREEILEMARTTAPVPPRSICRDTACALEAICLKAMAREKSHRYESALAVAEDVQRFLAGEPVSAYRERLVERAWRWAKRHHRVITRAAVLGIVVCCVTAIVAMYRDAATVRSREQARLEVKHVRHLADTSRFYAATTDPPGEVAPYYDVGRAEQSGLAALDAAAKWGPMLAALPLAEEREPLRRELADLCLRLTQLRLAQNDPSPDTIALLDRADALATEPSRTSHRLRAQAYRSARRDADAAAEQRLADGDSKMAPSAHDLFLEAESLRLSMASQPAFLLGDREARRAATRTLTQALALYQAALRQDPSDYWTRLQLGRSYLALGRGAEAIEALSACIALRPQSPWAYSCRAIALALQQRFDEAKLDVDRALQLDPESIAARLNRGMIYRLQNRSAEAAAEFDALLALPKPPLEAAIYRGQLSLLADNPQHALDLLANFPQKPVCLLRADAHLRLGQLDQARRDLDALLLPTSDELEAAAMRGHLLRCLAADLPQMHQPAALHLAAAELRKASEKAPTAAALADLGAVLYQQGNYQAALEPLGRAIALSPGNLQSRINRGWTNVALDRLASAQADFAAALRLTPDQAEALCGLGYVAARAGNAREAALEASLALANAGAQSSDYRILHNVACIYAQLSVTDPAQAAMHEQAAIGFLQRAVESWRRGWRGPHELDLIRREVAFPSKLRNRADFQKLLAAPSTGALTS